MLLVGVALELALADGSAIQGRTPLQKNFHTTPCTKIPYTKIRYKNHLRGIHLHQFPVCGPALEMLDEVHQSNPLQMWSYTGNLG